MIKEIKFTDNAIKHINEILSKKDNGIYFRIAIKGGGCSGFKYDFSFEKKPKEASQLYLNSLLFIRGCLFNLFRDLLSISQR